MDEFTLILDIIETAALVIALGFAGYQIRQVSQQIDAANKSQFTSIMLQAESDFNEINRLMLADAALLDTYRVIDPLLPGKSDEHLKRFVFYELYYGHLARLYVLLNSEENPYRRHPRAQAYWALYGNLAKYLLRDPVFREVHESARSMKSFESSFMDEIDRLDGQRRQEADGSAQAAAANVP